MRESGVQTCGGGTERWYAARLSVPELSASSRKLKRMKTLSRGEQPAFERAQGYRLHGLACVFFGLRCTWGCGTSRSRSMPEAAFFRNLCGLAGVGSCRSFAVHGLRPLRGESDCTANARPSNVVAYASRSSTSLSFHAGRSRCRRIAFTSPLFTAVLALASDGTAGGGRRAARVERAQGYRLHGTRVRVLRRDARGGAARHAVGPSVRSGILPKPLRSPGARAELSPRCA